MDLVDKNGVTYAKIHWTRATHLDEKECLVIETQSAGRYEVEFDASNLSNGTYIYRLKAGGHVEARQMMFLN